MTSPARQLRRRKELSGMSAEMIGWSAEDRTQFHRMVRQNMRPRDGRMKRTAAGRKAYRDVCGIIKARESGAAYQDHLDRVIAESLPAPSRLPLIAGIATPILGVAGVVVVVFS